eukprot:UC4_evm3s524
MSKAASIFENEDSATKDSKSSSLRCRLLGEPLSSSSFTDASNPSKLSFSGPKQLDSSSFIFSLRSSRDFISRALIIPFSG